MLSDEKIAKDACDYLFRVGKHADARVEFDPVGYLRALISEAVETERIACADIALNACLVPPDGGSPTEEERLMCERASCLILARFVPQWHPGDDLPF